MKKSKFRLMKGIIGLHTCSCHLFDSYEAANAAIKQKLPIGTPVKKRCGGASGIVHSISDQKGYVIVMYGPLPKDKHLEHVQRLIKI
jgi:cobyrinic acid a,c-diamide synthase